MSTAVKAPPRLDVEMVTTLDIGPGGLAKFLDLVPRPPGRIRYRDGSLTIVSPSFPHEHDVRRLDYIVGAICEEFGIAFDPAGSTLYCRDDLERGVMPDNSYYIEHQGALRDVEETVDLSLYPPPDLVVEVVWTHGAAGSLAICRDLSVPEVWVNDIPAANLQFLHLDQAGSYVPRPRSRAFPYLAPGDVLALLRSGPSGESMDQWLRRLRAWVREVLAPRRAGP